MIVKNKKTKIPFKCSLHNGMRLTLSADKSYIRVDPWCTMGIMNAKPVGIIQFNEIDHIDVYNKILSFYNDNHDLNTVYKSCVTQNDNAARNNIVIDRDDYNTINRNYICNWYDHPINKIEVSIQETCNLNCIMCRKNVIINKDIDVYYFKILEQLKNHNIERLQFTSLGEPFFYKEKLFNYLNSLTSNDFKDLIFISNLTLLNDDDINMLAEILNRGIQVHLIASIDGITEETYRSIRNNKFFDKVMHNAVELKKRNILYSVNFVLQDKNLHELMPAYEYWTNVVGVHFNVLPINQNDDDNIFYVKMINSDIYKNYIKMISSK